MTTEVWCVDPFLLRYGLLDFIEMLASLADTVPDTRMIYVIPALAGVESCFRDFSPAKDLLETVHTQAAVLCEATKELLHRVDVTFEGHARLSLGPRLALSVVMGILDRLSVRCTHLDASTLPFHDDSAAGTECLKEAAACLLADGARCVLIEGGVGSTNRGGAVYFGQNRGHELTAMRLAVALGEKRVGMMGSRPEYDMDPLKYDDYTVIPQLSYGEVEFLSLRGRKFLNEPALALAKKNDIVVRFVNKTGFPHPSTHISHIESFVPLFARCNVYVTATTTTSGDSRPILFSTWHSPNEVVCVLNADACFLSDVQDSHRLIDDTSALVSVVLPGDVCIVPPSFVSVFHHSGRFCQMLLHRDRVAEAIDLVRETLSNLMD